MFITFEGCEGSGKTTIIKKLEQYFLDQKRKIITTREPGGEKISEEIRKIILNRSNQELTKKAEALLFAASRIQHLHDRIIPYLEKDYIVICDRFIDSSYVYQGIASDLGMNYILKINDFMNKKTMPDITFLLDLDVEVGLGRVKSRGKESQNRIDLKTVEYHNKVRNAYLALAKKNKKRYIIINANQDSDSIFLEVVDKLSKNKKYLKYEKLHKLF